MIPPEGAELLPIRHLICHWQKVAPRDINVLALLACPEH